MSVYMESVVRVEYNGIGILDHDKDNIFDKRYKSGDNAGERVGLYTVKEIVDSYD